MRRTRLLPLASALGIALAGCTDQPTGALPAPGPGGPSSPRAVITPMSPESSPFGINTHSPGHAVSGAQVFEYVKDASVGWVRVDFIWAEMEPMQDSLRWARTDSTVAWARQRGLNVLATLAYTPRWASADTVSADTAQRKFAPPRSYAWHRWQMFVSRAALRYPDIKYWAVWNEPNCENFLRGRSALDYATLVNYAAGELHNPVLNRKVVAGEIATYGPGAQPHCAPNHVQWLADAINHTSPGAIDVVSLHAYGLASDIGPGVRGFPADLGSRVTGGWRWPMWLTEAGYGLGAGVPSEATVASHLQSLMGHMLGDTTHWKKTFYWHAYTPEGILGGLDSNSTPNWGDSTQVFPRQGFLTFKDVAASCDGCTPVHRLYNAGWNDHMDSPSTTEGAPHWLLRDRYSYWLSTANTVAGAVPLYRCWVASHHYMSRDAQCEAGVPAEGVMGYATTVALAGTTPLLRYRDPVTGDRFTTIHTDEGNARVAQGWVAEGSLGYVWR